MPLTRAQLSTHFLIERLRTQTLELTKLQYPGDHLGPKRWLDLIEGLLTTADSFLLKSKNVSIPPQAALELIKNSAELGSMAYKCLEYLRGADINELPYPIVQPLQRWFDDLKITNGTFFRAELVANYEYRTIDKKLFADIRDPSPELSSAIDAITWPLLRVTVPSKAFAILPHFAIVAHEIGHGLYHKITWDAHKIQSAFGNEQAAALNRIYLRLGINQTSPYVSDVQKAYQKVFLSWFEELVADAFAFYLTGPAFFFALSDFLQLLGGTYGITPSHPAKDLRRNIIFKKLNERTSSFLKIFNSHTGQTLTEDYNCALLVKTPANKDDIYQDMLSYRIPTVEAAVITELHESITKIVDVVYSHVEEYMTINASASIYTVAKYDLDLNNHLVPILSAIPPIEDGVNITNKNPSEFASILNVGWTALLTKLPEIRIKTSPNDNFGSEKLKKLHDLLLKAVELSEARRDWEQA